MIEQEGTSRKKPVISLFFHLFDRFSVWLYTILCNCFPARLLTSFEKLELAWSDRLQSIFGTPDTKFRRNLHNLRLRIASMLEQSKILRMLDRQVDFLIYCPLNVFGIFFLIYGAIAAAVYFIANRMDVSYAGDLGWGIAGIIIALFSLPLLCSSKPLYHAAFGSRILGKFLRTYLGLAPVGNAKDKKEKGNTLLVYAALILGAVFGALTFFYHPATVPLLMLLSALAIMVLYIPEAGVLLAAGTVSIWWITGYPAVCAIGISIVTLISFVNKLVRGKRVMHIRLIDAIVMLLGVLFLLQCFSAQGGLLSTAYALGYVVLIAMYFPIVNLMLSREWLNRCYTLLAVSGAVISVIAMLPFTYIFNFLDQMLVRVDFSMMSELFENYNTYFDNGAPYGGLLLLLLPVMLAGLTGKRSLSGFFWKAIWVVAGLISVFVTMQFGVWMGFGVTMLLFFFMYSYRALSVTMLLGFPVACGAVWFEELERLLNLGNLEIVHAIFDVIVTHLDSAPQRQAIAQSVFQMSTDHANGVGLGMHAVGKVFPHYAASGMESVTDMQNTYLQILAECGYPVLIVLSGLMVMFTICVLTYLRWGSHQATKARVVAGFAGVVGVMVMALSLNLLHSASVFAMVWIVLALTVASIRTQYEVFARAVQTHYGSLDRTDIAFRTR